MIKETLEAVKSPAQAFTYRGKMLSFADPDFPLAVFTDGFLTDTEVKEEEISQQSIASVEDYFEEVNESVIDPIQDERESIIANTRTGVAKLQYNAHNVLIPAIKAMCDTYAENFNARIQPDISVDTFEYHPVHNSAELVNHVSESYSAVNVEREYKTYLLQPLNAEEIIDFVANCTKHFPRETVTEWLLSIGADRINNVFTELFLKHRRLVLSDINFLQLGKAPFNVDEILLAYLLLEAYRDNPTDKIVGESVTSEDWSRNISVLHMAFGRILLNNYAIREEMRNSGQLVLKYDSERYVHTCRVKVIVNHDVAEDWLSNNSVEAILGAAVSNRTLTTVAAIDPIKEQLSKIWNNTYPIIKKSAFDKVTVSRRDMAIKSFMENLDSLEGMIQAEGINEVIDEILSKVSVAEYSNHFLLFTKMVCLASGSDNMYLEYLEAIDEYSQTFPNADQKELETQALITVIALYLSKQIIKVNYKPQIDNTPMPEGEPADAPDDTLEESGGLDEGTSEDASEEPVEDPVETEGDDVETEDDSKAEDSETESENEGSEKKPNDSQDMLSEMDDMDSEDPLE